MRTAEAANGKWRGILKHFGLSDNQLRNVHQSCPLCGGTDRYRYDDKDGSGSYYCSGCGAGNGFDLLMKFSGMDFKTAAKKVDEIVGNVDKEDQIKKPASDKRVRMILEGCRPITRDDPAGMYLQSRSLPVSRLLMFNPKVSYFEDGKIYGSFPAMVARMHNHENKLCLLHVTYLDSDGKKAAVSSVKKYTQSIDRTEGAHIRLTSLHEEIGIAEGIETALAVMKLYKVPCWASGSANFMESFKLPEGVKSVTVYADNDENFRGQAAAYNLANSIAVRQRGIARVVLPEIIGDFADVLKNGK